MARGGEIANEGTLVIRNSHVRERGAIAEANTESGEALGGGIWNGGELIAERVDVAVNLALAESGSGDRAIALVAASPTKAAYP